MMTKPISVTNLAHARREALNLGLKPCQWAYRDNIHKARAFIRERNGKALFIGTHVNPMLVQHYEW